MERRVALITGAGLVIAFMFAIFFVVVEKANVQSAPPTPPGFEPIPADQVQAARATLDTKFATARSQQSPVPSAITPATETAVAKPLPTCAATTTVTASQTSSTIDPNNPNAGLLRTAQAQNAPYLYIPSKTTDLAPQVPSSGKESIIVRHPDCSYERYLVASDQVNSFVSGLAGGNVVVIRQPAQPYVGVKAPAVGTAPGTRP